MYFVLSEHYFFIHNDKETADFFGNIAQSRTEVRTESRDEEVIGMIEETIGKIVRLSNDVSIIVDTDRESWMNVNNKKALKDGTGKEIKKECHYLQLRLIASEFSQLAREVK